MWEAYNTQCYEPHEEPECICWRDVTNDLVVSPWYAWQGIRQNPTMQEFFDNIKNCSMNPENLVLRTYENGNGIVLDYGLRKQFWIPNPSGWDLEYLRTPIAERDKEQVKIKPCPFCGGNAELIVMQEFRFRGDEGWIIKCTKCGANTATGNGLYSAWRDDVIKWWNRRAFEN
ncbi:Lar family restriction alleviation protein [Eisenbergiella porci]|uniref:Lar family restriction alleviation protein n=1 Tax=Eisenbergiella porci TaxID=2652274 RepID=UPI003AB52237